MDLNTLKSKLNDYDSIGDVLNDFRLIWENCRQFNAPGSEIVDWANTLAESFESLVEVTIQTFEQVLINDLGNLWC